MITVNGALVGLSRAVPVSRPSTQCRSFHKEANAGSALGLLNP